MHTQSTLQNKVLSVKKFFLVFCIFVGKALSRCILRMHYDQDIAAETEALRAFRFYLSHTLPDSLALRAQEYSFIFLLLVKNTSPLNSLAKAVHCSGDPLVATRGSLGDH
jgi:hypothetical protein